jgi:hypothetical protein
VLLYITASNRLKEVPEIDTQQKAATQVPPRVIGNTSALKISRSRSVHGKMGNHVQ